uniref:RUN domain-containing protein n=1 Tax=Gouania willdenowi TaxID=441366 RepID=A0A8C5N848_GOUWI
GIVAQTGAGFSLLILTGLLRSVSRAVDLIMAHFGSSRDPEVKMRLGKSSCSPTIAGLVLEHLCPAIQILLEDGLRDHNLDFIIGQRRNHSWNVVEISTRTGTPTDGTISIGI